MAQQYKEVGPVCSIPPVVVCPARGDSIACACPSPPLAFRRTPLASYGPEFDFCTDVGMYVCRRCDFAHGSANSFAVHLPQ